MTHATKKNKLHPAFFKSIFEFQVTVRNLRSTFSHATHKVTRKENNCCAQKNKPITTTRTSLEMEDEATVEQDIIFKVYTEGINY